MLYIILSTVDFDEKSKNKFETIYFKYRNMLFGYAIKLVGDKYDAEDILQETFFKIAKNIKEIRDINSKETASFLTVILRNTAYDFSRKKSKITEIDIETINQIGNDEIGDLIGKIQYEDIVSIIKSIPSPYCEVLYMHYVRDFSVKHTANLLERKTQTVKMQLVRGKKILINKLSEVDYD